MLKTIAALEEIQKESPDDFAALEKIIENVRISLAVKKVDAATDTTSEDSTGSHPHP